MLAVSEDGAAVVPLLGGHRGANELASKVAAVTGGRAAITTASDTRFGSALDAPRGYTLANPANLKAVLARLLAGDRVRIEGDAPFLAGLPAAADAALAIRDYGSGGDRRPGYARLSPPRPGRRSGVRTRRQFRCHDRVRQEPARRRRVWRCRQSPASPRWISKADEPAVGALAEALGVPARFFTAAELDAEASRLRNPSEKVRREVGCPGVAEGAALRAAGRQSRADRRKSSRAPAYLRDRPRPATDRSSGGRPRARPSFRRRHRARR